MQTINLKILHMSGLKYNIIITKLNFLLQWMLDKLKPFRYIHYKDVSVFPWVGESAHVTW